MKILMKPIRLQSLVGESERRADRHLARTPTKASK